MLLLSLMAAVEQEIPKTTLKTLIDGWRLNAHRALTADDYRACVDGYLDVYVDARMFLFHTGTLQGDTTDATDESHA